MKKIFLTLLIVLSILFVLSCEKKEEQTSSENSEIQEESVQIANPIKNSSLEEIIQTLGVNFAVPQDAKNIGYSIIADEIAQATFIWNDTECCVRVQPTNDVELQEISGFYYSWSNETTCQVGYNQAQVKWTVTEAGEAPGICIWLDVAPGIAYSVSMKDNADSEKLCELANLVYIQLQGEA